MKKDLRKKVISLKETGYDIIDTQGSSKQEGVGFYFLLGKYSELGFVLVIPLIGGILIGGWVDRKWSTFPKATIAGIFIGMVITFGSLVSIVRDVWPKKKN